MSEKNTLTITDNRTGKSYEIPITDGAIRAMDIRKIKTGPDDFGLMSYDPAFTNTASTRSAITFIDGDQGILWYRGYPIEQLAEQATFLEVAYLVLRGELPTQKQLDEWTWQVTHHTWVHENVKKFMDGFHHDAHPMGMFISTVAALSTFYPDAKVNADAGRRDLQILRREKEKAGAELGRLRSESELVEDAISMMAHGIFPAQPIETMQFRDFYNMLKGMTVPESLRFYDAKYLRNDARMRYYWKSFQYLDEDRNIPRFFTLYLTVPRQTAYGSFLEQQVEEAVGNGLGGVQALELEKVASNVDAINGVQVQMAERYDIGPFWNRFTDNPGQIQQLLNEATGSRPEDSIIAYRKLTIVREREVPLTGIKSMWKALWSGDWHKGTFSSVVSSPDYLLMPHRLIQKAYNLNIKLGNNVRTYGIKTDGGILD